MSGTGLYARPLLGGAISQSAVRMTEEIPEALQNVAISTPVRALVLAVYYPEEDERTGGEWAVTVDVRTLGEKQRYINNVPVYPLCAGLHDEDLRIPRPASIDAEPQDGQLAIETSGPNGPRPTDATTTDGDIVMLDFEESDPMKPFVMPYGPPHAKRGTPPTLAAGRTRRIRHNGTLFAIDKDGNVMIDATAAKQDALAADGSQVANPSGGNITIKTMATPGLLSLQDATDFLLKGSTYKAEMETYLQTEIDQFTVLANAAVGPLAALKAGFTALALGATTMKATAATWLSTRTKE